MKCESDKFRPSETFWDGKLFQYRELNGEYQIYSRGLEHIAMVSNESMAEFITNLLEEHFKK